jgi:UDP-N-acetylglucosamine acyltransferase
MRNLVNLEPNSNHNGAVHPTSYIRGELVLGEGATIGPFCTVEGSVRIGAGTSILGNSTISGNTIIGAHCTIGPYCVIGAPPQHRGYDGAETFVVIEDDVVIREFATVHRAMTPGLEHATHIGRGAMLMVGSHVAHDSRVGEYATLANAVQLGGHVSVGDRAFLGGGTVIHQHVRVGRLAIVAGGEALAKDVMPYGAIFHDRHKGYNAVGCRRAGMEAAHVHALRAVFRRIHAALSAVQAVRQLRAQGWDDSVPAVRELLEFIETSARGIQPSARAADQEAAPAEAPVNGHASRTHAGDRWAKERVRG